MEESFKSAQARQPLIPFEITRPFAKSILNAAVLSDLYIEMFQKRASATLGVLCLSTKATNSLLWAHYAQKHQGFAVGFDGEHSYFNSPEKLDPNIGKVREVCYAKDRVQIRILPDGEVTTDRETELYFTKGEDWKYEAEWRIVRPLEQATLVREINGTPIHLFEIPSIAIREVVYGAKASESLINQLKTLLKRVEYKHVALRKAKFTLSDFTVQLNPA
jgi:hypothetical protein